VSVRLRRLEADYVAVRRLAHLHPKVSVEGVGGNPPDRYRLVLAVRGLRERGDRVVIAKRHRLEIVLPRGYPRDAPLCRMLTPVFHPNVAPHAVCIGDHWSAAERLDLMIQRIGEMLALQSYNIKSPLNGSAARWVEANHHRLPIDKEEFFIDLDSVVAPEPAGAARCSNCGAAAEQLVACPKGHALCAECVARCESCGELLCLSCGTTRCPRCAGPECANCGAAPARAHACESGHALCEDCAVLCTSCGRPLCLACGEPPCRACAAAGGG
jgi:ubiquitin-protein ligase